MIELKKPYVRVTRGTGLSYGGSQMWSASETVRVCGCGPVAVLDTILYLTGRQDQPISEEEYNRQLVLLSRRYFPLVKPFGINGLLLALGMNRLLRKYDLPYRAFWAVSGEKIWDRIRELLEQDIPAILSVGPNFPAVWGKERLCFYSQKSDGSFFPSCTAQAHYVCVTGMDEDWLRISSWGRAYFIRRSEYDEYVRKHSASLVSNVLMLQKKA